MDVSRIVVRIVRLVFDLSLPRKFFAKPLSVSFLELALTYRTEATSKKWDSPFRISKLIDRIHYIRRDRSHFFMKIIHIQPRLPPQYIWKSRIVAIVIDAAMKYYDKTQFGRDCTPGDPQRFYNVNSLVWRCGAAGVRALPVLTAHDISLPEQ